MMPSELSYSLSNEDRAQTVRDALTAALTVRELPSSRFERTYFDTFDGRLYRAGGQLFLDGEGALVWQRGDQRLRVPQAAAPTFTEQLPEGELRRQLEPFVEMRRLLPILKVQGQSRGLAVLNEDEKTVVRLFFEHSIVQRPSAPSTARELPVRLRLSPLRGYDKALRRVQRKLEKKLELRPQDEGELASALLALGLKLDHYSSKLNLALEPSLRADTAAKEIHRRLLTVMTQNEAGLRQDLDSEFLHDFRVAVRRTRSALSQVRGVFPPARVAHFKAEFAWLGKVTGPTRDLDVYLLKLPEYRALLPAPVAEELEPLHAFLEERQRLEHGRLVAALDSVRYRQLLADWQSFLAEPMPSEPEAAGALRPIGELAAERIWKVYRRLVKDGRAIQEDTPAEAVHRLRIDGKKLRYLLEFFRSLFDEKQMQRLIKALKGLQDNLGDFNDYEVQQHQLRQMAQEMLDGGQATAASLMAMGRLVAELEKGQQKERRRFHTRFDRFDDEPTRRLFRTLFGPPKVAA